MSTLVAPRSKAMPTEEWMSGVSADSDALSSRLRDARRHFAEPVSRQSTAALFAELVATWKADTMFTSSSTAMIAHPAYQRIIGLGSPAVPLLLALLRDMPDHWFAALAAITGADPVPDSERGDVTRMADTWLRWGRERRFDF